MIIPVLDGHGLLIAVLFFLFGILFAAGVFFLVERRKKRQKYSRDDYTVPYIRALSSMAANDSEKAISEFTRVVERDTNPIEPYINLGVLFREKGELERAIRIHHNLLARPGLDRTIKVEILSHLGEDYKKAGLLDRAIATFEEAIKSDKTNLRALKALRDLYETTGEWEKADVLQRRINRLSKVKDNSHLAYLQVAQGQRALDKGNINIAIKHFKASIHLDHTYTEAYVCLGDAYYKDNNITKAISVWEGMMRKGLKFSYIGFERLEKAYLAQGRYEDMGNFLREIISKNPENVMARLSLVRYYQGLNLEEKVIEEFGDIVDKMGNFIHFHIELLKVLLRQRLDEQIIREIQKVISILEVEYRPYVCTSCGYKCPQPLWHCPQCKQWDTFAEIEIDLCNDRALKRSIAVQVS